MSDAVEVPLTQGYVAIVDAADIDAVVAAGPWHVAKNGRNFYGRRTTKVDGRRKTQMLHAFLTGYEVTDHINGNGLDNRRVNLRPATSEQNAQNRRRQVNSSGFKGVRGWRNRSRWQAYIKVGQRQLHLGCFATPEGAARAYDIAAQQHFGPFARLNFPEGEVAA